jgi:uncharacterized protein (TIGR03435 family)
VDNTGLAGLYDYTIDWPDASSSIVTAIEDQLGLKLEVKKAAVEVLVIDKAEKPSAN